jgi:hypothetical protein
VELDFSGPSQSEIAYIDRFESYSTYFQVHFLSGYSYRYSARREEPIEPLAIPEKPAFTVTETSPHAFRFDTDIEYKRTGSTWRYSENFQDGSYISSTWTIHTTKRKSITAGRLPEPLLQAYPSFDPDKMVHANTYLTIQGNTYDAIRSALASPSTSDFPLVQETIILDSPEN